MRRRKAHWCRAFHAFIHTDARTTGGTAVGATLPAQPHKQQQETPRYALRHIHTPAPARTGSVARRQQGNDAGPTTKADPLPMVHETRRVGHTVLRPTHHWEARVPLAKDGIAPGVVPVVVRAEDHAETARPAFAFHLPVVSLDLRAVDR